jgi:uncharacterized cupin superfamily protein
MPKIDKTLAPVVAGSRYPAPFGEPCAGRTSLRLGDVAGLTQFGVNLVRLPPGAWSSQRHWHALEDEFVYLLEGELVLVTDEGEASLRPGDGAGFKAGERNGHCLQNRSITDAVVLTVGSRNRADSGEYPDIDLKFEGDRYAGKGRYLHKNGKPY